MASIIDSYSESNQVSDTSSVVGQSFTGDGKVLDSAQFYLKKSGSPTGSVYAKIYAHSGTFGTDSIPTGSALATSDAFDPSTLTTSFALTNFAFSGANRITLTNGTKYVVTFEHTLSFPNYVLLGQDTTSSSHAGNKSFYSGGWSASGSDDLCFYVYGEGTSPSASVSPSVSVSASPSITPSESSSVSLSPSISVSLSFSLSPSLSPSLTPSASPSLTPSTSVSPSPSAIDTFFGLKIAKEGINVLNTQEPFDFIFNSDYGTLKYFSKVAQTVTIDGSVGDFAGTATINHNLGYYPFAEVYVRVLVAGSPVTGNYEYVPFAGSGATVTYSANFKLTLTTLVLYAEFNGVSSSEWTFEFIIFLYKNNLNL